MKGREMDKSEEAFRTISETAEELDVPQHVLRFWETRFSQIKPMKRGGGRRYYRPEDVDLLKGIRKLLYGEGYTIRGVQKILKDEGKAHVSAIGRGEAPLEAETSITPQVSTPLPNEPIPAPEPPAPAPAEAASPEPPPPPHEPPRPHLDMKHRQALLRLVEELENVRNELNSAASSFGKPPSA